MTAIFLLCQVITLLIQARDRLDKTLLRRKELEKEYIISKGIKNKDGSIPADFDYIDDPELIPNVVDFYIGEAQQEFLDEKDTAHDNLEKAENDLIAWGLTTKTPAQADTLRRGMKLAPMYRTEVIRQFLEIE
jgi:hypothetical protein